MIITKEVEVKIINHNIKHFLNLGYDVKHQDNIIVPPKHLTKGSHVKVKVRCDVCNSEKEIDYCIYLNGFKKHNLYTCSPKCAHMAGKNKKTCLEEYGDENYNNIEKSKQTKLEKHGDENYNNPEKISKVLKNKSDEEKQEIYNKRAKTKLKIYGDKDYNNREKNKNTIRERYNVDHNSQRKEFKESVSKTWEKKTQEELDITNSKRSKTRKEKYDNEYYSNPEKCKETWENKSDAELEEINNKRKQTKLEKHGDENYNNGEKAEETNLKIYGVKTPFQSPKTIQKSKQTKLERYDNENYVNSKKTKQTKLENHGDENYNNPEKAKQTSLKNHGVEHPMRNIEIFEKCQKNAFSLKEYKLPSGKIIKVQGYEPLALDILLKTHKEEDLIIENKKIEKRIGKIHYYDNKNKEHRYFPDIYIISENKIIEVKSTWTFKQKEDNIFLKEQACLNMNMKYEFMVFNGKKQLLSENEVKELI